MLGWHFVGKDRKDRKLAHLGWEICEGHKLHHNGPLKLCKSGLHASVQLLDALQYAPGSVLCRVEVGGRIIRGDDKLVASERTVLWMVDIEDVLHRFALWCARRALFRELAVASDAARDAARDAEAAWAAALLAVERTAARDARDAWDAARATEHRLQERTLRRMVEEARC